jgi:hypothetical protein
VHFCRIFGTFSYGHAYLDGDLLSRLQYTCYAADTLGLESISGTACALLPTDALGLESIDAAVPRFQLSVHMSTHVRATILADQPTSGAPSL